ncbi:MAG: polyprenyl synthetase family protein [Geminicoccaceae bacterium]
MLPSACAIGLAQAATTSSTIFRRWTISTLRRGKPCAHLVFPRWAVDMAPVFLLSLAYELSLANEAATADRRARAAVEMSRGGLTMIAGQAIDVTRGDAPVAETDLVQLARLKAGAFYGASAMVGAILCGANAAEAAAIRGAGESLGLAYQMLDDVADVTASVEEIGKDPGLDDGKFTIVDRVGVDGARRRAVEFQAAALARLEGFGREADFLRSLITEASWKAS